MRGRQQVYPTFECAPNPPNPAPDSTWDMPIFRAQAWARRDYVHSLFRRWGMSPPEEGARAQLGDAAKFRYSSICFCFRSYWRIRLAAYGARLERVLG